MAKYWICKDCDQEFVYEPDHCPNCGSAEFIEIRSP